ncbi:acyl-CoA dehydrogenase family protein [Microbacterium sp. RD1]|uniref:acyl-CoA dehydrogenase family protein n=1 Tax=Microbacterium sp. RD1 TaxID=3457313 RepID=UPI003FA5BEEF
MTTLSRDTADALTADLFAFQSQLTEEEQCALVELREFLDEHVRPYADDWWDRAESPRHLLKQLGQLGIFSYGFDETRPFASSSAFRNWIGLELARCDPSTAVLVGVHVGLGMGSISLNGSDEQRAEWLPPLAAGELIAAFGLTEPEHGSDTARGLATTAELRGDEWVLNGAKRWIGNATFADVVVIWARDVADDRVKGFLVRTPAPGFTATKIERKISMRAVENADIVLTDVVVPERDRLKRAEGFRDVARVLRHTRLESAWHSAGVSMGAFEAALAYAQGRRQFGRPIAAFQLVQQKLADVATNITATLAVNIAASRLSDDGALAEHHSSLAKTFAASRLRQSVALCREVAGGNGVQLDAGIARYFGDAEAIYSFEGTHEMNSLILARALTGHAAFVA